MTFPRGDGAPPPDSPTVRCSVCGRPVPPRADGQPPLCASHLVEHHERRRNGVPLAALDPRWWDTFETWRGRPVIPDAERLAARLRFKGRFRQWVLFVRGYPDRLPDWLGVDTTTGGHRQFVAVSESVVKDTLLGHRPAPRAAQGLVWGQESGSRAPARAGLAGSRGAAPGLPAILRAAAVPVYGLPVERVPGGRAFRLRTAASSWESEEPVEVSLTFEDRAENEQQALVNVSSGLRVRSDIIAPALPLADSLELHAGSVLRQIGRRVALDLEGRPEQHPLTLNLDGLDHSGILVTWAGRAQLCAFSVEHGMFRVQGFTLGLPIVEAKATIGRLVRVNEDGALAAAYEAQLNDRRRGPTGP